jgi:hypothetical protein
LVPLPAHRLSPCVLLLRRQSTTLTVARVVFQVSGPEAECSSDSLRRSLCTSACVARSF